MTLDSQSQEHVEDPETHPAFQAMRLAASGRPERRMGESIIAAESPRWSEAREHAGELASGPVHLEVLTTLVRAGLALDGFGGLERAMTAMAETLEQRWDSIFPEPDEDDPDEPWYARSNLLADLAAGPDFREALQRTSLVSVRGIGTFSARDLDVAGGQAEAGEEERARCQAGVIDGAFAEAPAEALGATAEALDGALLACRRIGTVVDREVGAGASNAIAPLVERLSVLRTRFLERAGTRLVDTGGERAANGAADRDDPDGIDGASSAAAPTASDTVSAGGAGAHGSTLADHDAVRAALDGVTRYYARHEPGSPVAVLAARTRELVGRGFFELVGTLYPETGSGEDLAARLGASRGDTLATLLVEGFGRHLAGGAASGTSVRESRDETDTESGETAAVVPGTRADVIATIDDILAFYRVREPSSPVPSILVPMRTLVPLDFDGVLDTLRKAFAPGP